MEKLSAQILETIPQAPFALNDAFVSVQGADAMKFLQGQVSCDMEQVTEGQLNFGTASTPKGRMYALFSIAPWKEGYLVKLPPSMIDSFLGTLSKYAVFFKCSLSQETTIKCLASLGDLQDNTLTSIHSYPLDQSQNTFEHWVDDDLNAWSYDESRVSSWQSYRVSLGIPELRPDTSEKFVLQHLNLQQLGAVSFKKGCYTGQEIIARMKFLGKQKKKTFLISYDQTTLIHLPVLGSAVTDESGKKRGELVNLETYHPKQGQTACYVGLASLDIEFGESGAAAYLGEQMDAPFKISDIEYPAL